MNNNQMDPENPVVVTQVRLKRGKMIASAGAGGNQMEIVTDNNNSLGDSAVLIRNLCKRYQTGPPVITNLCMNVRKGTIYGLLGESGGGKTTVLSCIVGVEKWNSGEVLVYGQKPGSENGGTLGKTLGYMPQDYALYNHLSIYEMIQFYGRLYNMKSEEVNNRWTFLNKLLDLPTNFRLIGNLSGGQKRRASLCLALIQAPDLIILDEPTVGLDPLLRKSIWNHLYKMVSTLNTTIIITTHYIEEARLSNTIGVMRKGRIIVEDTPARLLYNFQCDLLEDVVLHLCRQNENSLNKLSNVDKPEEVNKVTFTTKWKDEASSSFVANHDKLIMDGIFRKAVGFDCDMSKNLRRKEEVISSGCSVFSKLTQHPFYESVQRVRGLTTIMLLTFIRHPIFIAVILLLPTIHGSLTLATIGTKPKDLKLGVVNKELYNWSHVCDLPNHSGNYCDLSSLSCKFLNEIKTHDIFNLISVDSEKEARELVQRGQSWGYLTILSNYSQDFVDRLAAKHYALNESIDGSTVSITLDFSQYVASFFMIKDLYDAYAGYIRQLAVSCQIGGKEAETPLLFRQPVYGTYEDGYTNFLMPGVILICLLGVLTILTSVIFITDRKQGTLSRARVAGLATTDVMVSHMITQGLVALAQVFVWSLVLHICYGFQIAGSVWLYLLITFLSGLCGAAIGIVLGILCYDEVEAMIFGVFWLPILLLFGGVFWPMESMPLIWQYVGYLLPTTLPILSLRSIIGRGVGFTHPTVWPGVLALFGWTILCSICVVITYKKFAK